MAGELITTDYQVEYNGALLGAGAGGTELVTITGLDDLPELRTFDKARSLRHGLFPGEDLAGLRTIVAEFEVWGSTASEMRSRLEAVLDATVPRSDEIPLVFQVPGHAFTQGRVLCRARQRSAPIVEQYVVGNKADVVIQWEATDPRVYDNAQQVVSSGVTTASGGLSMPLTMPLDFGGTGTSGQFTVDNTGNFSAPWSARIDGPITNPQLENLTAGTLLRFDLTLASGEFLVLDSDYRLALLNGVSSRYGTLTADSAWRDFEPGVTTLRFSGTTAGAPTVEVSFRAARV